MNHQKLAKTVFKISNPKGEFRLRSGQISNEYFDKYLFESQPSILKPIADEMSKMVPSCIDILAGKDFRIDEQNGAVIASKYISNPAN